MIFNYAGATLTGQVHRELGQENQDSFLITKYSFGMVMVVADGLGTKKYSGIGSKRICKAVGDAARIWVKKENAPIEFLIRLVHNLWDISIYPYSKNECATTCLFCIALNNGKIILGQLGDGIIYYCNNESLNILSEKENDFLNITNSVASVRNVYDWNFKEINIKDSSFTVLMTTDGLSEDIIESKRKDFMCYIKEQISLQRNQTKKNKKLKKILRNCEGKYNVDDKTLIIFSREVSNE